VRSENRFCGFAFRHQHSGCRFRLESRRVVTEPILLVTSQDHPRKCGLVY